MSYHQGPTWPWLLGLYYDALMNMKDAQKDNIEVSLLQEKIKKSEINAQNKRYR